MSLSPKKARLILKMLMWSGIAVLLLFPVILWVVGIAVNWEYPWMTFMIMYLIYGFVASFFGVMYLIDTAAGR